MPSPPSTPASTGLTALHVAVINNDLLEVRTLLSSKEHAVDARTTEGATPTMLASLYGRHKMFIYLLHKGASIAKRDFGGFACIDYAKHLDFVQPLLDKYKSVAHEQPRLSGRKMIEDFLRPFSLMVEQDHVEVNETPRTEAPVQNLERRVNFHRKVGMLEIVEVRRIAAAEWDFDLGRKTCAAIRSSSETEYLAITISGWRGDVGTQPDEASSLQILNNDTYLNLIRDFRKVVGYQFKKNPFDNKWRGSTEKDGAFHGCHAEKQLAIFVLRECIARVLNVRDFSLENMAQLKLAIEGQIEGLQKEYIIELEHKPCNCCIRFLKLIQQKSGLQFKWVQREWFVKGQRSKLKPKRSLPASQDFEEAEEAMDIIDVEDDDLQLMVDDDLQLVREPDITTSATASPGEDSDDVDNDWVLVRRPLPQNRRQQRDYEEPEKAGSEVDPDDYPPRQKRREKLLPMPLTKRRKQIQKQKNETTSLHQALPSSDTRVADELSPDTFVESPPGEAGGSNLTIGRRHMPVDFEILIPQSRVGRASSVVPFPDLTEFMSRWSASDQNQE